MEKLNSIDSSYTVEIRIKNSKGKSIHWDTETFSTSNQSMEEVNEIVLYSLELLRLRVNSSMKEDIDWLIKLKSRNNTSFSF